MTTTGLLGLMGLVCLCAFARAEGEDQNTGHVSHHWTYAGDADGTDPWTQTYANCAGKKQSPINIEPKNAIYVPLLHDVPLELIGYENPLTGIGVYLTNNGHTVVAGIGDHSKHDIGISGAALSHYTLAQMHWHWGSVNWRGSEHTVRGVPYAMEMHLVHINKRYVDNDTAIHASPKGLAVLGVFIEVGAHNPAFNEIVKYLANTSRQDAGDKTVPITIPTLRQFLPADLSKFFRYSGSLTTPPCSEAVIWTVFKQPIQISQEQLDAFRTKLVKDKSPNRTPSKSNLIADNFRPVLPLNDRRLYVSYDTAVRLSPGTIAGIVVSCVVFLTLIIVIIIWCCYCGCCCDMDGRTCCWGSSDSDLDQHRPKMVAAQPQIQVVAQPQPQYVQVIRAPNFTNSVPCVPQPVVYACN